MGGVEFYGLPPGPFLYRDIPDIVWTVTASLVVGNVLMLILNVPLFSAWVQILRVRCSLLVPFIDVLTLFSSYTITNSISSLCVATTLGVVG